jgi:hypothetical protein
MDYDNIQEAGFGCLVCIVAADGVMTDAENTLLLDMSHQHPLFRDQSEEELKLIIGASFEAINSMGHQEFLTKCADSVTRWEDAEAIFELMMIIACTDGKPGSFEMELLRFYQAVQNISDSVFDIKYKAFFIED